MQLTIKICLMTLLVLSLANFKTAKAMDTRLPQIMVGQVTMTQKINTISSKVSYGGFMGNEVILNYNKDTSAGFDSDQSAGTGLAKCLNSDLKRIPACFYLSLKPSSTAVKLMRSRTKINGEYVIEAATLLYGSKIVMGDVYSGSSDINNFAFWGKNVTTSNSSMSSSDAALKISGYSINNESQSAWIDANNNDAVGITLFGEKINSLKSNGTTIPGDVLSQFKNNNKTLNIYLQAANDSLIKDTFLGEKNIYPDGKVWVVDGDLVFGENDVINYFGVGTIIIKGNLTVGKGTKIVPANDGVDQLGFMVMDEQ